MKSTPKEKVEQAYRENSSRLISDLKSAAQTFNVPQKEMTGWIRKWQLEDLARRSTLPIPATTRAYPIGEPRKQPQGPGWFIRLMLLMAALNLECISATFTVMGLTTIATGNYSLILWMGIGFEGGKIAAVAWIGRSPTTWLKVPIVAIIAVLMTYSIVGCYGFMVKSHLGSQVNNEAEISEKLDSVSARIDEQERVIAAADHQLFEIDSAIQRNINIGKPNAGMDLANSTRNQRTKLELDRQAAGKVMVDLKLERAHIEGQRKKVEANLGPIKYVANLLGVKDDVALTWFLLGIALVLDPCAMILLLAATTRYRS